MRGTAVLNVMYYYWAHTTDVLEEQWYGSSCVGNPLCQLYCASVPLSHFSFILMERRSSFYRLHQKSQNTKLKRFDLFIILRVLLPLFQDGSEVQYLQMPFSMQLWNFLAWTVIAFLMFPPTSLLDMVLYFEISQNWDNSLIYDLINTHNQSDKCKHP